MKFKEIEKELISLGFSLKRITGSHHMYVHNDGLRPVLLCRKAQNSEFGHKLVARILKEAKQSIEMGITAKEKRLKLA